MLLLLRVFLVGEGLLLLIGYFDALTDMFDN